MTFLPAFGVDHLHFININHFPHSSGGLIIIPCMSDLVEKETQTLASSLGFDQSSVLITPDVSFLLPNEILTHFVHYL